MEQPDLEGHVRTGPQPGLAGRADRIIALIVEFGEALRHPWRIPEAFTGDPLGQRPNVGVLSHRGVFGCRRRGLLAARAATDGTRSDAPQDRSEEHTSELQSLMRTSYA